MTIAKFHYSYRRQMIDDELSRLRNQLAGCVLDLGGKKIKKRGYFIPPTGQKVARWIYVNKDIREAPDLVVDAERLPFVNDCFDWIICTEVLEFIRRPDQLVKETHRTLKSGGQLFLTAPFLYRIHGKPDDLQRFTEEKLSQLFSVPGFSIRFLKPQGFFFTVMADFMKSAIAQVRSAALRYLLVICMSPMIWILYLLDRLPTVQRSDFFSSFTTGYTLLVVKR